jgi:hypothetical protein
MRTAVPVLREWSRLSHGPLDTRFNGSWFTLDQAGRTIIRCVIQKPPFAQDTSTFHFYYMISVGGKIDIITNTPTKRAGGISDDLQFMINIFRYFSDTAEIYKRSISVIRNTYFTKIPFRRRIRSNSSH